MEKQMRAERDRRAAILVAEGDAQARVRVAEAEAEAIQRITEAIASSGGDPSRYLIAIRYIDTLKEMVSGSGNKVVYLPYEASALLGSIGSIRDLFEGASPSPPGLSRPGQSGGVAVSTCEACGKSWTVPRGQGALMNECPSCGGKVISASS